MSLRPPAIVVDIVTRGDRRRALAAELREFPARMRQRGREYFADDRVQSLDVDGPDAISASVIGTDEYTTVWGWSDIDGWDHFCSCPVGTECKHAAAVASLLIEATRDAAASTDGDTQPASDAADEPLAASRVVSADDGGLGGRFLRQLLEAEDAWERRRPFEALLAGTGDPSLTALDTPFSEILQEPEGDILCWRLASAIAAACGGARVPQALRAYLARHDLRERYEGRARRQVSRVLRSWTDQRVAVGKKRIRFVFDVSAEPAPRLSLEVRLSSARIDDEPRTLNQISALDAEVQRSPQALSAEEAALLRRVADEVAGSHSSTGRIPASPQLLFDLFLRQGHRQLVFWADDLRPELASRLGLQPGAPVQCEAVAANVQPEIYSEGSRVLLGLFVAWPDGRRRRIDRALVLEPLAREAWAAAIGDGAVWLLRDLPPDEVLESFRATGPVEIPPAERAQTFARLAASFDNVAAALALHTRPVPVEAVVALDLRAEDWVEIRVFARERGSTWTPATHAVADERVFERTTDGRWIPARPITAAEANEAAAELEPPSVAEEEPCAPESAPETAADGEAEAPALPDEEVWLEAPDREAVDPVLEWLRRIGAQPYADWGRRRRPRTPDGDEHLWLPIDEETIADFVAGWVDRPQALYFGNPRLRRLLAGEDVIRPKVQVQASGTDWFRVSATWEAEGMALSAADVAKLRGARKGFVRLTSGWVRTGTSEEVDDAENVLADLGIEIGGEEQKLTLWQLAGAPEASLDALDGLAADSGAVKALRRLRQRVASFAGIPEVPLPEGLQVELRPYQRHGLDFLCHTAELGLGAILADDMGLGKTVQALAWLAWLKQNRRGRGPALVVCPTSVAPNWVREAERFVPGMSVLLLGRGRARLEERKRWRDYDLIVTNYALLRQDEEFWREAKLRAVIFDEAQNIKNPDAVVARAAQSLAARYRLALTGTPLENRALDLWSIVEAINPGYLGRRSEFTARYDQPELPDAARRLLAAKLRPMLLRRLKRDVATELPERIEERLDCELTAGQRKLYLAELRRSRALVERVAGDEDGLRRNKIEVLAALTRLRQICCHPRLAGGEADLGSGKFEALFELLETLRGEGHKVLVFSQFVRCLDLIAADLTAQGTPFHVLTGQSTNREKIVRDFQEDPDPSVFLISLRAGGTGLNLTAASHVVLFDPWWNPAVEAQAIDRTHRIGQDKTVIACRLVAAGTVEEKIFELQQRKAALARDVLGEDGFARTLSRDDLEYLLTPA